MTTLFDNQGKTMEIQNVNPSLNGDVKGDLQKLGGAIGVENKLDGGENKDINTIPYSRFKEINDKLKEIELENVKFKEIEKLKQEEILKNKGDFETLLKQKEDEFNAKLNEKEIALKTIEIDKLYDKYNLNKEEYKVLFENETDITKIDTKMQLISSKIGLKDVNGLPKKLDGQGSGNEIIFTKRQIEQMSREDYNKNRDLIRSQISRGLIV